MATNAKKSTSARKRASSSKKAAAPAKRVAAAANAGDDPRDAELRELRDRLDQLTAERSTGGPVGFGNVAASTVTTPAPPANVPDYAAEWPAKGGLGDAPQPWDLHNLGLSVGTSNDGTTTVSSPHTGDVLQLQPGQPDTVSPIVPIHGRPMLSGGSAGDAVIELGQKLALLGYDNTVSRGQNPMGILDDSIAAAVDGFRRDWGVEEDPSQFPRNAAANAQTHVGPWTWEALLRAVARIEADQARDGRVVAHAR